MGGVASGGQNNDELVDNLLKAGYIKTRKVERVFRAVDRADYVLSSHRANAYKDIAWKHGNIHLSAPCIYSEVMEELRLKPGQSFLNLGSGTGYLSTMVGLILGQYGTNHGVELHSDCISYAYDRLEEFKENSLARDEFDFCEPIFVQGNCLSVIQGKQYDRVYCGVGCPEIHEAFIKQFVKVRGILIMPYNEQLVCFKRFTKNFWERTNLLPVSFATLVIPSEKEQQNLIPLPDCVPLSLQKICRGYVRRRLRQNVWTEHPELEVKKPMMLITQIVMSPQRATRYVIPIFEESDEDDNNVVRSHVITLSTSSPTRTALQRVEALLHPSTSGSSNSGRPETENQDKSTNDSLDLDLDSDAVSSSGRNSDSDTDRNAGMSSDSTGEKAVSASQRLNDTSSDRVQGCGNVEERSNVSDGESRMSDSESHVSDSETEQDCVSMPREKTNNGIVEAVDMTNDDDSDTSGSIISDLDTMDAIDDSIDVDVDPTTRKSFRSSSKSSSASECDKPETTAHYVDNASLLVHMKEKIVRLPLPHSLKLYVNYNRDL